MTPPANRKPAPSEIPDWDPDSGETVEEYAARISGEPVDHSTPVETEKERPSGIDETPYVDPGNVAVPHTGPAPTEYETFLAQQSALQRERDSTRPPMGMPPAAGALSAVDGMPGFPSTGDPVQEFAVRNLPRPFWPLRVGERLTVATGLGTEPQVGVIVLLYNVEADQEQRTQVEWRGLGEFRVVPVAPMVARSASA